MIQCKADETKSILIKRIPEDRNRIGIVISDQHDDVSLSVYLSWNDCQLLQSRLQQQMNRLHKKSR